MLSYQRKQFDNLAVTIFVRPSAYWETIGWTFLKAIPSENGKLKPISKWADKDEAWKAVTDAVRKGL